MRIGELAERSECQVETIRFYEKEGLLPKPMRSAGNYRVYGEAHVERLRFVRHCRSLGMTLKEVRALLGFRDSPARDCGAVNALIDAHIRDVEVRVRELMELRQHLTALRESCQGEGGTAASCGILQGLADGSCHA